MKTILPPLSRFVRELFFFFFFFFPFSESGPRHAGDAVPQLLRASDCRGRLCPAEIGAADSYCFGGAGSASSDDDEEQCNEIDRMASTSLSLVRLLEERFPAPTERSRL